MITDILIKKFSDIKKSLITEDKIDIIILITSLVVLAYTIVMAALSDIQYDEAYTYIFNSTRNSPNFLSINLANNHPLNSFLIYITSFIFPYNEFAIRLPNLIFLLIYLISSIKISKVFSSLKILVFSLLVLYWFLIPNYFSIGRGYGISAAIVLLFLVKFVREKQNFDKIIFNFYILLLACYAFPGLLPLIIALSIYYLFFEIRYDLFRFIKIYFLDIFFLLINFSFILYYLFSVSAAGKPLYGSSDTFLNSTLKWYLNSFSAIIPNLENSIIIILSLVFIAAMCIIIFFNIRKAKVSFITIITFFLFFITSKIFDRPNITGRLLVPLYPLVILSLIEILNFTVERLKPKKTLIKKISFAVFILLVFNYVGTSKFRLKNNNLAYKKEIFEHLNLGVRHNNISGFTFAIAFYKKKFFLMPPYKLIRKKSSTVIKNITKNLDFYYLDDKHFLMLEAHDSIDIKTQFFIEITPLDTNNLLLNRKIAGFNILKFSWSKDNEKYLIKEMPNYKYSSFSIGQYDENGEKWRKTIKTKYYNWEKEAKEIWPFSKNWKIPNDTLNSTFPFIIKTDKHGIYKLATLIKLFKNDATISPRITLQANYKDGTSDIERDFKLKKNEKFIKNQVILSTNSNKKLVSITGFIIEHGGIKGGNVHAEIKNVKLIFKSSN